MKDSAIWTLILALGAASALTLEGDAGWPQFRGRNGAGIADGANPPTQFGPATNLLWKVEIAKGHSSPIWNGTAIFLTGRSGQKLETVCIDPASGNIRWRKGIDVASFEKVHSSHGVATPTPACDADRVYSYFGSFGLVAYDFDGNEVWRKPLPAAKTFMNQGTGTSPICADGAVIVFEQNGDQSLLMAFDGKDGHERWAAKCPVYNNTWSTPAQWREKGGDRIGLACAGRFTAYNLKDGRAVWWTDGLSQEVCATPLWSDGTLYLSSASVQGERSNMKLPPPFEEFIKAHDTNGDGLISFDEIPADLLFTDRQASGGAGNMKLRQAMQFFAGIDKSKPMGEAEWDRMRDGLKEFINSEWNNSNFMAVRDGGEGDVTKSNRVWQETRGIPEITTALIYGNRIYQIRSGGLLVCRDQASGKTLYEQRLAAQGGYFASPVAADGRIYVLSDQGVATVIQAGDHFVELARNELGESVKATPAIGKGVLFVRSAEHLWAFGNGLNP